MIRASIVHEPIVIDELMQLVASPECGASAAFVGTVRSTNDGREVSGIEYSAYAEMAELEMMEILAEAGASFGLHSAIAFHRVGKLVVGDTSIAVAVSHGHRGPAMDALRYIVDQTKARAPVWKLQEYADGSQEWVGAVKEPPAP